MDESGYTGAPFYGLPPDSVWTVKWSKYHTLRYGVTITISDGPEKSTVSSPSHAKCLKSTCNAWKSLMKQGARRQAVVLSNQNSLHNTG